MPATVCDENFTKKIGKKFRGGEIFYIKQIKKKEKKKIIWGEGNILDQIKEAENIYFCRCLELFAMRISRISWKLI